jgi:hypothetical protein
MIQMIVKRFPGNILIFFKEMFYQIGEDGSLAVTAGGVVVRGDASVHDGAGSEDEGEGGGELQVHQSSGSLHSKP